MMMLPQPQNLPLQMLGWCHLDHSSWMKQFVVVAAAASKSYLHCFLMLLLLLPPPLLLAVKG